MVGFLAFEELCDRLDREYGKPEKKSITICKKIIGGKKCNTKNRATNIFCENCHSGLKVDDKIYAKIKHFRIILRVLAERGPSSVNEITKFDGLSSDLKARRNRASVYNRIIRGNKQNNVMGLIEKGLVLHVGSKIRGNKDQMYCLTESGVLYALYLLNNFKNNKKFFLRYSENKDQLLENIVKNYGNYFPMVFGKWDFLKQVTNPLDVIYLFGGFRKIHVPLIILTKMATETIESNQSSNLASDFSLWFYVVLTKIHRHFPFSNLKKDPEIANWLVVSYYDYQKSLKKEIDSAEKIIQKISFRKRPKYAEIWDVKDYERNNLTIDDLKV